jgi:hypothetical protein
VTSWSPMTFEVTSCVAGFVDHHGRLRGNRLKSEVSGRVNRNLFEARRGNALRRSDADR